MVFAAVALGLLVLGILMIIWRETFTEMRSKRGVVKDREMDEFAGIVFGSVLVIVSLVMIGVALS